MSAFFLGFVACYLVFWAVALWSVWGRDGVPRCAHCLAHDMVAALLWPMVFWLLDREDS